MAISEERAGPWRDHRRGPSRDRWLAWTAAGLGTAAPIGMFAGVLYRIARELPPYGPGSSVRLAERWPMLLVEMGGVLIWFFAWSAAVVGGFTLARQRTEARRIGGRALQGLAVVTGLTFISTTAYEMAALTGTDQMHFFAAAWAESLGGVAVALAVLALGATRSPARSSDLADASSGDTTDDGRAGDEGEDERRGYALSDLLLASGMLAAADAVALLLAALATLLGSMFGWVDGTALGAAVIFGVAALVLPGAYAAFCRRGWGLVLNVALSVAVFVGGTCGVMDLGAVLGFVGVTTIVQLLLAIPAITALAASNDGARGSAWATADRLLDVFPTVTAVYAALVVPVAIAVGLWLDRF